MPLARAGAEFDRLEFVDLRLADQTELRCRVQEVRDEAGSKVAGGIYIYRLVTAAGAVSRKAVVLR